MCRVGDTIGELWWLYDGVNRLHQRIGDTLMGRSLGEASVVVNAGVCVGDTMRIESPGGALIVVSPAFSLVRGLT